MHPLAVATGLRDRGDAAVAASRKRSCNDRVAFRRPQSGAASERRRYPAAIETTLRRDSPPPTGRSIYRIRRFGRAASPPSPPGCGRSKHRPPVPPGLVWRRWLVGWPPCVPRSFPRSGNCAREETCAACPDAPAAVAPGSANVRSPTRGLATSSNQPRTCGKYSFRQSVKRRFTRVFSSTVWRRSSTRKAKVSR
jgi:hypothetical protein